MARPYNTLGRRILAILREGGRRSRNVLLGLAASAGHTEQSFHRTIERLTLAGRIRSINCRRGGVHYEAIEGE
jgi:hypothetical protein